MQIRIQIPHPHPPPPPPPSAPPPAPARCVDPRASPQTTGAPAPGARLPSRRSTSPPAGLAATAPHPALRRLPRRAPADRPRARPPRDSTPFAHARGLCGGVDCPPGKGIFRFLSCPPMARRPAKTVRVHSDSREVPQVAERFAMLLVVQGAEVDLGTQVPCDEPVTIGRDADIELPLRDGSISRRHCRVERGADGSYVLADLGSTNGTRLNGSRVQAPTPLSDGDKIYLGATIVKFGYADELDAQYHARLETMAATDALTGLLSSRKFDAAFAHAVADARETGAPLAVLVMDMDGLKQIND